MVVGAMVGGMKVRDVYSQQQSGMNVRSFMGIRISQEKREKKKSKYCEEVIRRDKLQLITQHMAI